MLVRFARHCARDCALSHVSLAMTLKEAVLLPFTDEETEGGV